MATIAVSKNQHFSEISPGFFAHDNQIRYILENNWAVLTSKNPFVDRRHGTVRFRYVAGKDALVEHIPVGGQPAILHLYKGKLLSVSNGVIQYNPLGRFRFYPGVPECQEVYPQLTEKVSHEDRYVLLDEILQDCLRQREVMETCTKDRTAAIHMRRLIQIARARMAANHFVPVECSLETLEPAVQEFYSAFASFEAAENAAPKPAD